MTRNVSDERLEALAHRLVSLLSGGENRHKLRGGAEGLTRQLLPEFYDSHVESWSPVDLQMEAKPWVGLVAAIGQEQFAQLLCRETDSAEVVLEAVVRAALGPSGTEDMLRGVRHEIERLLWKPVLSVELVLAESQSFSDEIVTEAPKWPNPVLVHYLGDRSAVCCPVCGEVLDGDHCPQGHHVETFKLVGLVPGALGFVSYAALRAVVGFDSVLNFEPALRYRSVWQG